MVLRGWAQLGKGWIGVDGWKKIQHSTSKGGILAGSGSGGNGFFYREERLNMDYFKKENP
jgi:hypothetical protein